MPARRKASRAASRRQGRRRSTGALKTRARSAARELESPESHGIEAAAGIRAGEVAGPANEPAEAGEGTERSGGATDREAAELARRIEATVGRASETLHIGPATAAEQLGAHREQMEEAARREEKRRDLPGAGSMVFELSVGALRLVRSLAAVPLRLAAAPLRVIASPPRIVAVPLRIVTAPLRLAAAPFRAGLALLRRRPAGAEA